jgi:hypothetical protein
MLSTSSSTLSLSVLKLTLALLLWLGLPLLTLPKANFMATARTSFDTLRSKVAAASFYLQVYVYLRVSRYILPFSVILLSVEAIGTYRIDIL